MDAPRAPVAAAEAGVGEDQRPTLDDDALYKPEWVAEFLGIAVGTLYNRVSKGKIPHIKDGRNIRFLGSQLRKYLVAKTAWPAEDDEQGDPTSTFPWEEGTGVDSPGVILENCSPEFRDLFTLCDLVIAKGQANYETLCDCGREIFFLTQVKCPVIARDTRAEVDLRLARAVDEREEDLPLDALDGADLGAPSPPLWACSLLSNRSLQTYWIIRFQPARACWVDGGEDRPPTR